MRTILVLATLFAIALTAADIAVQVASVDPTTAQHFSQLRSVIETIGGTAWDFGRPLLQLVVVLLILEWVLGRIGIKWNISGIASTWSIQTFIAVVIVSTFCLAILSGLAPVEGLKEIALIVIGFYFGTRARRETFPSAAPNLSVGSNPSPLPDSHQESSYNRPSSAIPPQERREGNPHQANWGERPGPAE